MNVIRLSLAAILAIAPLRAQSNPARVQFEVASIKPSPSEIPNTAAVGLHSDGAQVRADFLQLRVCLAMAYRLLPNQIVAPDWTDSERFDIVAKIPDGVKVDRIPEMLQALLEERFQLRARRDKKELPVYGLVAGKGGLKIKPLPTTRRRRRSTGKQAAAPTGSRSALAAAPRSVSATTAWKSGKCPWTSLRKRSAISPTALSST